MMTLAAVLLATVASAVSLQDVPRPRPDGNREALHFVELRYPAEALTARIFGFVVVDVTIDAQGRVSATRVLSGAPQLAAAAEANIKQWLFEPQAGRTAMVYRFDIDQARCNDDSRSLFRIESRTLTTIVASTGPNRPYGTLAWAYEPRPIDIPRMDYPSVAHNASFQGAVVLKLAIGANGRVTSATPLAGTPLLADPSVSNAMQWTFDTTTAAERIVVYEFNLKRKMSADSKCTPGTINEFVYPWYIRVSATAACIQVRQ